jgi:ketosteroid isomerase-like protein
MTPVETVLLFLERINQRNVDSLTELMTEDHVLTDSLGRSARGRASVSAGWRGYYAMCPDYQISHESILATGNVVAVFGTAGGTIRETRWQTPAAWRVVVADGLVKNWQVYADNKPVYDILQS